MDKKFGIILLIALLGAGLCVMIEQKKSNEHMVTLETCPHRVNFYAWSKDSAEITVYGCIKYEPTEVTLDEAKIGAMYALSLFQKEIGKYTMDTLFNGVCGDIEDNVNAQLQLQNEKLTWCTYFMSFKKQKGDSDTIQIKVKNCYQIQEK